MPFQVHGQLTHTSQQHLFRSLTFKDTTFVLGERFHTALGDSLHAILLRCAPLQTQDVRWRRRHGATTGGRYAGVRFADGRWQVRDVTCAYTDADNAVMSGYCCLRRKRMCIARERLQFSDGVPVGGCVPRLMQSGADIS
jgi:hypothetical protein